MKIHSLQTAREELMQFEAIIDYKICKWLHKISKICLQASVIDVVPPGAHMGLSV